MLDDCTYDIMSQLVEESQSLWRIKSKYKTDSIGCEKCLAFWEQLEKDKADHVEKLTELLKIQLFKEK